MELIIISDSKIKLMLTSDDMKGYKVNEGTREVLRKIMCDVRDKYGYYGMGERIFVQMYPSKEGGCEMFVTSLSPKGEGEDKMLMRNDGERTLSEYRKIIYKERGGRVIYSFESMGNLLGTCLGLRVNGYFGESSAFVDQSRRVYYLLISCETHIAEENLGSLCPGSAYYYINEHCNLICNDAVNTLWHLA